MSCLQQIHSRLCLFRFPVCNVRLYQIIRDSKNFICFQQEKSTRKSQRSQRKLYFWRGGYRRKLFLVGISIYWVLQQFYYIPLILTIKAKKLRVKTCFLYSQFFLIVEVQHQQKSNNKKNCCHNYYVVLPISEQILCEDTHALMSWCFRWAPQRN